MCLRHDRYMYVRRGFTCHNHSLPYTPLTTLILNDHITSLDTLWCFILLVTRWLGIVDFWCVIVLLLVSCIQGIVPHYFHITVLLGQLRGVSFHSSPSFKFDLLWTMLLLGLWSIMSRGMNLLDFPLSFVAQKCQYSAANLSGASWITKFWRFLPWKGIECFYISRRFMNDVKLSRLNFHCSVLYWIVHTGSILD